MCEQNLWIPLASLETGSVVAVRAAHLCIGSLETLCLAPRFKRPLSGSCSFTSALCHSAYWEPWKQDVFHSLLFLKAFLCLFLPLHFPHITPALSAIRLIGIGRVRCLLNWASRWLSKCCVCVCVLFSTHGWFSANEVNSVEQEQTRPNGMEWALIGYQVFAGLSVRSFTLR